jgi:hypothetical protein
MPPSLPLPSWMVLYCFKRVWRSGRCLKSTTSGSMDQPPRSSACPPMRPSNDGPVTPMRGFLETVYWLSLAELGQQDNRDVHPAGSARPRQGSQGRTTAATATRNHKPAAAKPARQDQFLSAGRDRQDHPAAEAGAAAPPAPSPGPAGPAGFRGRRHHPAGSAALPAEAACSPGFHFRASPWPSCLCSGPGISARPSAPISIRTGMTPSPTAARRR